MSSHTLSNRAMLSSLTIRQWSARKYDKRASQEIADNHNSDITMGRYNKTLVARKALADIQSAASALRSHHYANTLPWANDGARILPAANYFDYLSRQQPLVETFNNAVAAFVANYPSYVDEARSRLNGLFSDSDYQRPSAIASRFGLDSSILPLPSPDDFRVQLGDNVEAQIRADIETRVADATKVAMGDLWQRINDAVSHMAERLNAYSGKREGSFNNSLVENIRELCDLLPRLNLTGDAKLAEISDKIRSRLCAEEPQKLRDEPIIREQVARDAESILAEVSEFLA